MNKSRTSNLYFIGYIKQLLDKSSNKNKKHQWPSNDAVLVGPKHLREHNQEDLPSGE